MKKILLALTILGFTYISADAQTTTTTRTMVKRQTVKTTSTSVDTPNYAKNYKVCKGKTTYYTCGDKPSVTKKTKLVKEPKTAVAASNKDQFAQNYSVCKGKGDYHICNEQPNAMNSVKGPNTQAVSTVADTKPITKMTTVSENGVVATTSTQTYATQPTVAPAAPTTGNNNELESVTIRDTVNNGTAPYHGERSPQYDGPARNKARNLNTPPQSPNAIPLVK